MEVAMIRVEWKVFQGGDTTGTSHSGELYCFIDKQTAIVVELNKFVLVNRTSLTKAIQP